MKRLVGFVVAAFLLGGIIGSGVTLLVRGGRGTSNRTEPEIVRALRTSGACPDQPTSPITEEKTTYYYLSPPVQAESGDWYAECRQNVVAFGKSDVTSWLCYRARAGSLGITSIATPAVPLYGDRRLFGALPQDAPCDTIPDWPKPTIPDFPNQ